LKDIFFLLVHNKFEQATKLIEFLVSDFDLFIHIDKKSKVPKSFINQIAKYTNVHIAENRVAVYRAHFSLIRAVEILHDLSTRIGTQQSSDYRYVFLISGQDLPLKNVTEIMVFLDKSYPRPLIDIVPYDRMVWIKRTFGRFRFTKPKEIVDKIIKNNYFKFFIKSPIYFFEFLFTASNRGVFRGLKLKQEEIFCGSAWWAIPKDALNEIFALYNSSNNKYYKHISTPEEHFFQTYLMKTSFAKWVAFGKQYEKNIGPTFSLFLSPTRGGSKDGHPFYFDRTDFEFFIKSNDYYDYDYIFARKFDMSLDRDLYFDILNGRFW
jgi:hypothetical protein